MGTISSQEILEKIRNELLVTASSVKKREIDPNIANAMCNAYRSALTAEEIRLKSKGLEVTVSGSTEIELSEADKKRLDKIARLLSGDNPEKKRGRKPKAQK